MDSREIVDRARDFVEEGGDEIAAEVNERAPGVQEDLQELKDIATGEGSLVDWAKAAVEAVKDPGAPGEDAPTK